MWDSSKRFLVVASVALNLAFIGVWLVHTIPVAVGSAVPSPATPGKVWCPLHEQLDVTDQQWEEIEPLLREFRQKAQAVGQRVSQHRLEMLELLAAPNTDREAIAAKQEEIQAGQREMQGLVIGHLLAEKEILTAEQASRLFAMFQKRRGCGSGGPMMVPGQARQGIGRMLRDGVPPE